MTYRAPLFFFSSRRRHPRYIGDWSSDVCSSDLCRLDFRRPNRLASAASRLSISTRTAFRTFWWLICWPTVSAGFGNFQPASIPKNGSAPYSPPPLACGRCVEGGGGVAAGGGVCLGARPPQNKMFGGGGTRGRNGKQDCY